MSYSLRQFSPNDGVEGYDVLQRIGEMENDFTNPIHGKCFDEYKEWLAQQDAWSREEGLPDGYVGQTCFWLVFDGDIVGMGKIRHGLTARSREEGGNIGIAIDPNQRGKGLGAIFTGLLINKAKEMKVGETRTIVLPPELAYGSRGYPGVIPGNAYICFDITLLKF